MKKRLKNRFFCFYMFMMFSLSVHEKDLHPDYSEENYSSDVEMQEVNSLEKNSKKIDGRAIEPEKNLDLNIKNQNNTESKNTLFEFLCKLFR